MDEQSKKDEAADLAEEMMVQVGEMDHGPHARLMASGLADYGRMFAVALKVLDQIQATGAPFEPGNVKLYATIALAALHAVAANLPDPGHAPAPAPPAPPAPASPPTFG